MIARLSPWLLALWILVSGARTYAQADVRAFFTADIGSPLIGQPIDLLLTVEVPDGTKVNLPAFPTDWPPFMIQTVSEITTSTSNGITTYSQHLTVLLWQIGEYQTPDTVIEFQLPDSTENRQVIAQPAYFDVKSVLEPDDLNLRPLKPPVSIFYVSPLMIGTALLGLCVIGVFAWSKRKQFHFPKAVTNTNNLHPAAQIALSEIKRIGSSNNTPLTGYVAVSDALRRYLQGRFGVRAIDMTSQELMFDLSKGQDVSERRQRDLANLLEQADLVKFAGMQPSSKFTDKLLNVAYGWVMAVEQDHLEAAE
jgi:hypothetical protein